MLHVITGPSASLTFSWGNCTFNESQFLDSSESTKILNCTEPSIVYDKDPAIFTSKYKTGDSFTGKVYVVVALSGFGDAPCMCFTLVSCLRLPHL